MTGGDAGDDAGDRAAATPATPPGRGHRVLGHTADLAVEAWAPSRPECVTETLRGLASSFLEVAGSGAGTGTATSRFPPDRDEDLLVAVLEEVIYLLEVHERVPVDAEVTGDADGGLTVRFATAAAEEVTVAGAVPKAVSLHGLRFEATAGGWRSHVTVDV